MQITVIRPFLSLIYYRAPMVVLWLLLLLGHAALAEPDNNCCTDAEARQAAVISSETGEPIQAKPPIDETIAADFATIKQTLETLQKDLKHSQETAVLNEAMLQTLQTNLEVIEDKLKGSSTGLDESRAGIDNNAKLITQLKESLLDTSRNIKANTADLGVQKSLVEDNSIRLYEILIQISNMTEKVDQFAQALEKIHENDQQAEIQLVISSDLNRLWLVLATVMVFFVPLALSLSSKREYKLADGVEQYQGVLLICLGVFLGYLLVGFGLMYGDTHSGMLGASNPLLGINSALDRPPVIPFNQFVLYQCGFAILAAMVVYAAVGRILSSTSHLFLAVFVGAVLVPVFGHWAWSDNFIQGNSGWLEKFGFIDQAGAITINMLAAWFAFVIVWRLGKSYEPAKTHRNEEDEPVYSSGAAILLWMSWIGFNAGALPISSDTISVVVLNIGLAGAAGGLVSYLHYVFFHSDNTRTARAVGGFVSGLVAIAACAQSVTPVEALVIGLVAGLLKNMAYSLLCKSFLKQTWQARSADVIAIHGVASIWGGFCIALFGTEKTFSFIDMSQLALQVQGIVVAIVYSVVMANIVVFLLALGQKKSVIRRKKQA